MKKFLSFILIGVLIFSLSACNASTMEEISTNANTEVSSGIEEIQETKPQQTIADYFPFEKDIVMNYKGEGNEYAEKETFVEFTDKNKIQIKTVNAGTNFVNVLELKDGELREVFGEGEFYHIENMLDSSENMNNIILKEPLDLGASWESQDGDKVSITGIDKKISVPSGDYKALEVTTFYKDNAHKKDYYVKDIGLVATIYQDGKLKVSTILKSREKKSTNINVNLYYPNSKDTGSKYISKAIEFNTNDNIKSILEEQLKKPASQDLFPTLSENTTINKLNLNRESWTLEVDLSNEFKTEMNAGSSYELEIIDSLVNTLGDFYDVEKVFITVEDEPYSSGHLELLENDYFKVDTKNIEELKIDK